MMDLFQPSAANPSSPRASTWPYIQNICQYLSWKNASLYHGFILGFENGTFSEQILASMIRSMEIFEGQPYVQYLHEDLVLIILLNKLHESPKATPKAEGGHSRIPQHQLTSRAEKASSSTISGNSKNKKLEVQLRNAQGTTAMEVNHRPKGTTPKRPRPTSKTTPSTPKRAPVACDTCRRRKKRCVHNSEASSPEKPDAMATTAAMTDRISVIDPSLENPAPRVDTPASLANAKPTA